MSGLETRHRKPGAAQMLILLGALVVVIAGLKAAQGFFVPMLLAFFLATVSFPITNWLRNHKVPRGIAVLLTVLVTDKNILLIKRVTNYLMIVKKVLKMTNLVIMLLLKTLIRNLRK